MDAKYGEIRCPATRNHLKTRKGQQIKEQDCDKLLGFIDPDVPCDVMMFCTSCKCFIHVKNDIEHLHELSVVRKKVPTKNMMGIINECL